jgi:phosphoglycolate phosphatase-like HAD superfamily hydrolase
MRIGFDLDGTLTSCQERQVAVAREALRQAGIAEFDEESFWHAKRHGSATRDALVATGVPASVARRVSESWVKMIEEPRWLELDRLADGAMDALTAVEAAGFDPVIITARRSRRAVEDQLVALALASRAELRVVSPFDAAKQKALVIQERECVAFIGDTEVDARAAEIAGVHFAAVGAGQRDPTFLSARRVTVVRKTALEAARSVIEMVLASGQARSVSGSAASRQGVDG